VHALHRTYHRPRNHFGCTRCNYYVTWVIWNLVSVRLETVLVSVQDRRTVCAKCTTGSEIVLDASNDTLGDEAQVEAWFKPFGDSANLDTRLVHVLRRTYQKSFWMHPMEHHHDMGHVESRFGPFGDSVSVGARKVHGLHQTNHRLRNHFGRTQWYS
jgi:hypothetical protein